MKGRPKLVTILLIVLALGGVMDSVVLTYDHAAAQLNPQGTSQVCEPGSGCEAARKSPLSAIPLPGKAPGLPIALLGLACYIAIAGLALLRHREKSKEDAQRLLLGVVVLAVIYSAALAIYSLTALGKICKFCAVLYGVNLALLVVCWLDRAEPIGVSARRVWTSLRTPPAWIAGGLFLAFTGAGYGVYASSLAGDSEKIQQIRQARLAQARNIKQAPRVDIDSSDRPTLGKSDAPVTIVEFFDFQCGHCAQLYRTLHRVVEAHPDKLKVVMMHYPLDQTCNPALASRGHLHACKLARVGECAFRQERFEKVAEWLFELGAGVDDSEAVREHLASKGLDLDAFDACLASDQTSAQIGADLSAGMGAGVRATPTFFVNGHQVKGGRSKAVIEAMMEAVLEPEPAPEPEPKQ